MRRVAVGLLLAVVVGLLGAAEARGGRFALVVGVNEYDHAALTPLDFAENDAEEMAKTLTAGGFRVTLLTTRQGKRDAAARPTTAVIHKAVAALLAERTRHDTVVLSLSGHGVQLEVDDPDGKERPRTFPYFCPTDADTARSGIRFDTGAAKRLVNLNTLFADLADCGAGVKLVFVDACRNQQRAAARARNLNLKSVTVPEGVGALFSCAAGQVAYEVSELGGRGHGIFFHFVLEGLRGKAGNERGEVRWAALADYVTTRVTREVPRLTGDDALRQTPQLVANLVGESPLLLTVARAGEAAFRRGLARYLGTGGKIDLPSALKDLEDATADGHRVAQAWLAVELFDGHAGVKDVDRAQRLAAAAARQVRTEAEAGDPLAQNLLGAMHKRGVGVTRNAAEAARWYRQAADGGLPLARNNLGTLYGEGAGVPKDPAEAVRLFRQAADAGLPIGQFNLGWMYHLGRGVPKDEAEALQWYRKAAAQGYPMALVVIGWTYADGRGVAKDEAAAVRWFRRAIEQGSPRGEFSLGRMYAEGRGVPHDDGRAVEHFRRAAAQDVDAQFMLGTLYAAGRGVTRDDAEAVRWYRQAAAQGHPAAQCFLGTMVRFGRGVAKDEAAAVDWYRKSAEQGWAEGQYALGIMYARGWGVRHDPDQALRWMRKAADQGYEPARRELYPPPKK